MIAFVLKSTLDEVPLESIPMFTQFCGLVKLPDG
jgi:hypothetical protein